MLTTSRLAEIAAALAGSHALTVYIDGRSADPAHRTEWRQDLERRLETVRAGTVAGTREERAALEEALAHLERALPDGAVAIGAPGWMGLFTAAGVHYAEPQPFAVPTLVDWRIGGRLAPSVALLERAHAIHVVMLDARSARVYRYEGGALERLRVLRAHARRGAALHMGSASPPQFHQGTHGRAGADAAARVLRAGRERLYRELAGDLAARITPDSGILLGGAPERVHEAREWLPGTLQRRTVTEPALEIHARPAAIRAAAEAAVQSLRGERNAALVATVIDRAGARAQATVGWRETSSMLDAGAAREVFFTRAFLKTRVSESETMLRLALASGAEVSLVDGPGSEHLDLAAEGVGALLRYAPAMSGATPRMAG